MKITAVTPISVTFPFAREPLSFCYVRVDTDDGLVGWGEACDSYGCTFANVVGTAITDALAPLVVGEDLDTVEPLADRMRAWTRRRLGDQWVGVQARSAVEIALWDLVGKASGRSVASLLGQVRDRVTVYASSVFLEEGDASWHLDLLAPLLERGVRMVKVRIGPEWRADLRTLTALRGILDDSVELMIDGSEIFTLPTALAVADALADLGIMWFEEPLPQAQRAGIEELARRSRVPIAYGEHLYGRDDALDALRRGQMSVLQPDAATCGGIAEARHIAALATSYGARVVPHVAAGPIALAAGVHLAASVPHIRALEYPYPLAEAWTTLGVGTDLSPTAIVDGSIAVPSGPGLGVDLDEVAAAARPYAAPGARVGLPDRFNGDR
jgi:D-galactarolactone cycloisomerase